MRSGFAVNWVLFIVVLLQLPLGSSALALEGRVIDKSGAPIAGANIALSGADARTTTDPQGRFRLDAGAVAVPQLQVQSAGYRPARYEITSANRASRLVLYDRRQGPRLRTCSSAPPALLRLYFEPDFGGHELVIKQAGQYTSAQLREMGFPDPASARSLRLAPGHRVWIYRTGEQKPHCLKPEDDSDLTDDHHLVGRIDRIRLERAPERRFTRPRVFLALHGNQVLTHDSNDDRWRYVRRHLDGIWFNAAGLSGEQMAAIFRKVNTRVIIKEQDANGQRAKQAEWQKPGEIWDSRLEKLYPDIRLIREAMCMYHDPKYCFKEEISELREFYTHNPQYDPRFLYDRIYTLWQPFWVAKDPYIEGRDVLWGTPGEAAFQNCDGVGVECNPGLFAYDVAGHGTAVRYALRRTHEKPGRTFIWFVPVNTDTREEPLPDWFQMVKSGYYLLEAEGIMEPNDVIMIINYHGRLKALPEVDAKTGRPPPTLTGALYWLLHQ